MMLNPENAALITHTCCILHNYIARERPKLHERLIAEQPQVLNPNLNWQDPQILVGLERQAGNHGLEAAKVLREHLKTYYTSDVGEVYWQEEAALLHVRTYQNIYLFVFLFFNFLLFFFSTFSTLQQHFT